MSGSDPRAQLALDAHLFCLSELTRAGGGAVVERDGAIVCRAVDPTPFLINAAARVDPGVAPATVIGLARDVFVDRGYELICLEGRDEDLREAGLAAGMDASGGSEPLQYIDRAPDTGPSVGAEVEARLITDAAGVADVVAINQDAIDVYGIFPADFFSRVFAAPDTVIANHLRVYVGYEAGSPVATAQYARYRDVCYVGWVAVAQRAMRRGIGRWITAHALREAFADGVSAAVLLASPMGAPLYRRMGFVDVGRLNTVYASPAGESAARAS